MILNPQRRVALLAMMKALPAEELEDACNNTFTRIEAASRGEDVTSWEFEFLCDALEAWELAQ